MDESTNPRERRITRIVHRAGVTVFVLILLAALAGLIGKGPLSKTVVASSDDTLRVEYSRFIHYQGPVDLKIDVGAASTSNGVIRLRLSKAFVDDVEIERIDPQPVAEAAGAEFFTYTIETETNAATEVRVHFVANHFGRLAFEVGLTDRASVSLRHFAFP